MPLSYRSTGGGIGTCNENPTNMRACIVQHDARRNVPPADIDEGVSDSSVLDIVVDILFLQNVVSVSVFQSSPNKVQGN